ncbi:hypothetical protein [Anaerococcus nagyae]|uniref:hypothetical protein n=1 Tax=Anaerococcus nagyae TaxID=1755241 RepID=UPI002ADB492A|nr:hypothetical protein [Streptococcus agalactiae]
MKQINSNKLRDLVNKGNLDKDLDWCVFCDAKDRCDSCDATDFKNNDCKKCDFGTECTHIG